MASLAEYKIKSGERRFFIKLSPGEHPKRPEIRLGKVTKKQAQNALLHIEQLIRSRVTGSVISNKTAEWLAGVPVPFRQKLEKLNLVDPQIAIERILVTEWVSDYIDSRKDVKSLTKLKWRDVESKLAVFFDRRFLDELTMSDGKAFRRFLKAERGLSENTIRRQIGISRQFFRAAIDSGLIKANPFADQPVSVCRNESRFYFVTPEEAQDILNACPNTRWRLIFALCRFGGLRCPSEVLSLKWEYVDFERREITVHSSKTEHHIGGDKRKVPMFPELEPILRQAKAEAQSDAVFCVDYRGESLNLRSQFQRILLRAGIDPWPKLFQNLRSTRETELIRHTGNVKAVSSWLGNSPEIALKHYAQVTEADQKEALGFAVLEPKVIHSAIQSEAVSGSKNIHPANTHLPESSLIGPKNNNAPSHSAQCIYDKIVPTGVEPVLPA